MTDSETDCVLTVRLRDVRLTSGPEIRQCCQAILPLMERSLEGAAGGADGGGKGAAKDAAKDPWTVSGTVSTQGGQVGGSVTVSTTFGKSGAGSPGEGGGASAEEDEVRRAVAALPVSWLHQPRHASAKAEGPEPRIAPLVAAAVGVAVGAGIQIGSQQLRKEVPKDLSVDAVECRLPVGEIVRIAAGLMREEGGRKDGDGPLAALAAPPEGSRVLPVVAAAFLAGVATGAAAAR